MNRFLEMVEQLDYVSIPHVNTDALFVKDVQRKFIKGLLTTIDTYLDGKPAKAYNCLNNTLRSDLKDFRDILKIDIFNRGESFYRIRRKKGNFPLEAKEMFHIPFEIREIVATQRYSIPGFPCLYLGRTLYGCWEEMSRPDISKFQACRFESQDAINYLDLTRPIFPEELNTRELYSYFMTWPLIACCSIKVKNYEAPFKVEYIIPQLLLQWIRDEGSIEAIRFTSTHIDLHNTLSEGDFSNVVLPVKQSRTKGYCPALKRTFKITEPLSWQLKQFAIGGQIFVYGSGGDKDVDCKIPKLELIKGRTFPYSYSVLGDLERYLNSMPTTFID